MLLYVCHSVITVFDNELIFFYNLLIFFATGGRRFISVSESWVGCPPPCVPARNPVATTTTTIAAADSTTSRVAITNDQLVLEGFDVDLIAELDFVAL